MNLYINIYNCIVVVYEKAFDIRYAKRRVASHTPQHPASPK